MSEPFKVYAASLPYNDKGDVIVFEYEVIRETAKFYFIKTNYKPEGDMTAKKSDYRTYFKSAQEAVNDLYEQQINKLTKLKLRLNYEENRLELARQATLKYL